MCSRGPTPTPHGRQERTVAVLLWGESKVVWTVNPYSPNVGRFFLVCRLNPPCRFFQWLDQPDPIFTHRLEEARKQGLVGEREEKSIWLAEVDVEMDHQAQKKAWLEKQENETRVIPVPSLPEGKLESELENSRESRECWSIRNTCVSKKSWSGRYAVI